MKLIKSILLAIYGMQLFIVGPWFLGAMYRNEMSVWPWREYGKVVERHGVNDARLMLYLYLVFYLGFLIVPYLSIFQIYKPHRHYSGIVLILASWFLITFLILSNAIFMFLRALPDFRLVILWAAITAFLAVMWKTFLLKRANARKTAQT
jgi:hypothetical protein